MRSIVLAPGDDGKAVEAAAGCGADVVALDLSAARSLAPEAAEIAERLRTVSGGTAPRLFIRIDAIGADHAEAQIATALPLRPAGFLLSRTESGADLQHLGALLAVGEAEAGLDDGAIRVIALAETGAALFGLIDFARASGRLDAIAWDGEALARDLGGEAARDEGGRWSDPCQTARTLVLAACADVRLPAIDSIFSGACEEVFRREAETARRDGFSGKLSLDPRQAAIAAEIFGRRGG